MSECIERKAAIDACFDGWNNNAHDCAENIRKLPAADVRPVVKGKWVQTGGKYSRNKMIDRRILTCSVCGNVLSMEGVNAGRGDANYCPNCGADMREQPKEKS